MENILTAIFLIVLGGVSILMWIKLIQLKSRLSSWKSTKGKVLNKSVGERKILPGTDLDNFRVYLEYEYEVENQKIIGNHLSAIELLGGEKAMLKKMAVKRLQKIPENVVVWYNPEKPKESYLNPVEGFYSVICAVIGIPMLIGGIVMLFS